MVRIFILFFSAFLLGNYPLFSQFLSFPGAPTNYVESIIYEEEVIKFSDVDTLLNSPEALDFGTADADDDLIDQYEAYIADRITEASFNLSEVDRYVQLAINQFFPWRARKFAKVAQNKLGLYNNIMREIEFLEDLDNQWQWAIGAKSYIHTPKYYCECETTMGSPPLQLVDFQVYEVDDPTECDASCRLYSTREASQYVQLETNDGIITSTSAKGAPWADHEYKMEGSSHFQMRNDENTKKGLIKLYKGEINKWFEIK